MKIASALLFIFVLTTTMGQDIVDSRQRDVVILHVNIVPMDKEQVVADQTVIVKDGKIKADR
ncbi:MAG: amidohydrolase, partial [Marivirga sp.]|nr:amidohydrolase [Marivirga sp.]